MDKGKTYVKSNPVLLNASSILYEGGGKTLDKLFDLVYPVGSVYMSTNATSPATLFGGSWTKIEGRFLWATGSTPMTTGGSRTTDSTV
ncbi:MAG: phage baseplate protein, partial [Candidatus Coprovivens sp.]